MTAVLVSPETIRNFKQGIPNKTDILLTFCCVSVETLHTKGNGSLRYVIYVQFEGQISQSRKYLNHFSGSQKSLCSSHISEF